MRTHLEDAYRKSAIKVESGDRSQKNDNGCYGQ